MLNNIYHGKLLLFGEYTVILGGSSLAMPLPRFKARWHKIDATDEVMYLLADHIDRCDVAFDKATFLEKCDAGIEFLSEIPFGYGCGSSGALIAAIYRDFCKKNDSFTISQLQKRLGSMESFFHGKSSGIDPLVIYLNQAIIYQNSIANSFDINLSQILQNWNLYDSGVARNTAHLVQKFNHKRLTDNNFSQQIELMKDLNNSIIYTIMDTHQMDENELKSLSEKQLSIFKDFIPNHIIPVWEQGLISGEYCMKLCGAGGGGFFLVYGNLVGENVIALSD